MQIQQAIQQHEARSQWVWKLCRASEWEIGADPASDRCKMQSFRVNMHWSVQSSQRRCGELFPAFLFRSCSWQKGIANSRWPFRFFATFPRSYQKFSSILAIDPKASLRYLFQISATSLPYLFHICSMSLPNLVHILAISVPHRCISGISLAYLWHISGISLPRQQLATATNERTLALAKDNLKKRKKIWS